MAPRPAGPAARDRPAILVVDDDRRVVELLDIALTTHGFRVLSAADGEEALRVAHLERPDLIVLDVRLPKRSGLDVCERLRADPDDAMTPIIMVSAAVDTDARLQGLARGADDYMGKPFSPKELIARIRRLLARAADARDARRRGVEAERELSHAREDAHRTHRELQREQRLRDVTLGAGRQLLDALDTTRLARRLLALAHGQLGAGTLALLAPQGKGDGALVCVAATGEGFERAIGVQLHSGGPLALLLAGLGRPVRRQELESFPEVMAELAPLVAAGLTLVAPILGAEGLEAVLLADDRLDGGEHAREELDALAALNEVAAPAFTNARRCHAHAERMLDGWGVLADRTDALGRAARVEASVLVEHAARALRLGAPRAALAARAVHLAEWSGRSMGRVQLEAAAADDPSGRIGPLLRLLELASGIVLPGDPFGDEDPEERLCADLVRAGLAFAGERLAGGSPQAALDRAIHSMRDTAGAGGADADLHDALRAAASVATNESFTRSLGPEAAIR